MKGLRMSMLLIKVTLDQTIIPIPIPTTRVREITQILVGNKMTRNPPKVIQITKKIKVLIVKIKVIVTKGTVRSHMCKIPTKVQLATLNQNQTLS
jgi:hypothetical protein